MENARSDVMLKPDEAIRLSGKSRATLDRWAERGLIRRQSNGGTTYHRDDLLELVQGKRPIETVVTVDDVNALANRRREAEAERDAIQRVLTTVEAELERYRERNTVLETAVFSAIAQIDDARAARQQAETALVAARAEAAERVANIEQQCEKLREEARASRKQYAAERKRVETMKAALEQAELHIQTQDLLLAELRDREAAWGQERERLHQTREVAWKVLGESAMLAEYIYRLLQRESESEAKRLMGGTAVQQVLKRIETMVQHRFGQELWAKLDALQRVLPDHHRQPLPPLEER